MVLLAQTGALPARAQLVTPQSGWHDGWAVQKVIADGYESSRWSAPLIADRNARLLHPRSRMYAWTLQSFSPGSPSGV